MPAGRGRRPKYSSGDDPEGLAAVGNIADGTPRRSIRIGPGRLSPRRWLRLHGTGGPFQPERVGPVRHARQCLGVVLGRLRRRLLQASPVDDPGAAGPRTRVFRGGGWNDGPRGTRAANRSRDAPAGRYNGLGFRLAREESAKERVPDPKRPSAPNSLPLQIGHPKAQTRKRAEIYGADLAGTRGDSEDAVW